MDLLFAQASSGSSPLDFVQYGVLGLIVLAFITGWIWPKPAVDKLMAQLAASEARADEFTVLFRDEVLPAIGLMTSKLAEATAVIDRLQQEKHEQWIRDTTRAQWEEGQPPSPTRPPPPRELGQG